MPDAVLNFSLSFTGDPILITPEARGERANSEERFPDFLRGTTAHCVLPLSPGSRSTKAVLQSHRDGHANRARLGQFSGSGPKIPAGWAGG